MDSTLLKIWINLRFGDMTDAIRSNFCGNVGLCVIFCLMKVFIWVDSWAMINKEILK
jgi:hypothetical protein